MGFVIHGLLNRWALLLAHGTFEHGIFNNAPLF